MTGLRTWIGVVVLLLVGCDGSKTSTAPPPAEKVTILATVYPLADIARQVGGRHVNVSWVVEGGQSLNGFMPDADARNQLRTAELVVIGGATEPWANIGLSDPMQHGRIVRMDLLEASGSPTTNLGLLWLDPVTARNMSNEIYKRLRVLRPQLNRDFEDRSKDFAAQIDRVVEEYRPKLKGAIIKKVLVLSTDFNPLLQRFGLEPVQPLAALPMELDDAAIRVLKKSSGENLTRVLLVPLDTPAATVRDIETRGGFQVVRIDSLGSSASGGHDSYLSMLRFNLEQLLNATAVR